MKKGNKLIAKLLCFALVVLTVLGYGSLKAEAEEQNTTFTITIDDSSNITGNKVEYLGDNPDEWKDVTSGIPINIEGMTSITIKVTKAEGVDVTCTGQEGLNGIDVNGVTGGGGQRFELTEGTSYGLKIEFTAQGSATPSGNASLKIDIENQNSATGTVDYKFFNADGALLGSSGSTSSSTASNIAFPAGTKTINIKVAPGTNCQVNHYEVLLNGEQAADASGEAAISVNGHVITVSESTNLCEVKVGLTKDSTSDPDPSDAISFRLEGDSPNLATVEYSIDGGTSWNSIGAGNPTVLAPSVSNASVRVTFDSAKATVQGNITSNGIITSGTEYEVTEKKEYRIQVDKYVNTVTWAYDDRFGEDGKVAHGKVQIVSAVKAGETGEWSGIEPTDFPGANNNQQDETGGRVAIIPGSTVTVKIVPDYGYQFLAGTLNGQAITAAEEMSTFTFTMPNTQLHLSALFTASPDKFNCTAQGVSGASIVGGGNVINSGNLELEVKDSTISADKKQELQSSAAGAGVSVNQWLEVDLKQIVNKGNSNAAWEQDLEELTNKIRITLNVEKGLDATREYVVVREHNGVYEQIPADYDPVAGTLSFESDRFSNYAVGTADNKPVIPASREDKKVEIVVQKEASTKEKAPANIVQLPGGEKAVSSIGGVYNVESVEGVAVVTQKKDVYSAVGLSNEEVKAGTNVVLYMSDCLNKKTNQALNDVAVAANKKVVAYLTADMYTITKKGVINKVRQTGAPVELLIGVPQSARSANRQFSVVCIDPSKNVVTYNDMDTNPNTITVRANVFGNYAVVY